MPAGCGIPTSPVQRAHTSGAGTTAGLSYGVASGHYTYGWQTQAAWAGTCRQFSLQLNDGTAPHAATFRVLRLNAREGDGVAAGAVPLSGYVPQVT